MGAAGELGKHWWVTWDLGHSFVMLLVPSDPAWLWPWRSISVLQRTCVTVTWSVCVIACLVWQSQLRTGSSGHIVTWCPVVSNSVSTRVQSHASSCVLNGVEFSTVDFIACSRIQGVCVWSLLSGPEIPQSSFSCINTSNDMGLLGYIAGTIEMLILQCSPSSESFCALGSTQNQTLSISPRPNKCVSSS